MISKLANKIKDIRTILATLIAVFAVFPTIIAYWTQLRAFTMGHFDLIMIATIASMSLALALGHRHITKKESNMYGHIQGVQNGLSTDIQQVSSTMVSLHQENRIAHIKAEVDRVYNLQKDEKSLRENERGYIEHLDAERVKYEINSYSERRLEKLMKIKVEMD